MKKTTKHHTTTRAIMITSKEGANLVHQMFGQTAFSSILRTLDYNDITFVSDNILLFKSYDLAQEIAFDIQHESLERGGWATIFKVASDECFEQLTFTEIQKSLYGK